MDNNQNTKEKITFYQTGLGLVIGFLIIFLLGSGIIAVRWYQQNRSLTIGEETESGLFEVEFEKVEQILQKKTIPLEPKMEIMYGKDIGKKEPFQKTIEEK